MKKTYLFLCLALVFGVSVKIAAQVAPPAENLTHQWTFDDGTAKDSKGTVDGVLVGAATIVNKALNVNGGYVTLNATDLAINTYSELTVETWFTSTAGANKGYRMLYYFGDSNANGDGINYTCVTPTRGNNVSRAMISTGVNGVGGENGVEGTQIDDGILHHMVSVINATTITFYIDGVNFGTADLTNGNSLASLGTQFAYFAKGGYIRDPTWKGSIHKISIYDKALTDANITYMFEHGAEEQPVITTSATSFAFDTNFPAQTITVTTANLSGNITVTAPAGITVTPTTLPALCVNEPLTVVCTGSGPVDGVIVLTSGTTVASLPVKAVSDATCFVPLYTDITNLITDPGMNDLSKFADWGDTQVVTINSDPADVYCGASSIKVGDGVNGGSLAVHFKDIDATSLLPNTIYKIKVMAKTDGPFHLGIKNIDLDNPANNVIEIPINTSGVWQIVEKTFSTGARLDIEQVIYLNNSGLTGKIAYFDNWEMYPVTDQVITSTVSSLAFDPEFKNSTFTVTGGNLQNDITITAPAGITVEPATLPATAAGEVVSVTYDGTTVVDGNITLTSGSATTTIKVKSTTNSCFTPLYTDRPNLIPDQYLNDKNNFNGWDNWSIISMTDYPDSVYCGSHCARINGRGNIEVPLTDKLLPNYKYISKAMVKTIGGRFRMGINGHDKAYLGDFIDTVNTFGVWKEYSFEFHTGDSLATTPVIFFNNDQETGTIAYLDNWQLYAKEPFTALAVVKDLFNNVYVKNGNIVAEFDMDQSSAVQISVYNVQGLLVLNEKLQAVAGRNSKTLSAILPSGLYIVKIAQKDGSTGFRKVIK